MAETNSATVSDRFRNIGRPSEQRFAKVCGFYTNPYHLLISATRRLAKDDEEPLEWPGANSCNIFAELILERGVYVPTGTRGEREAVRAELRQSLGILPDAQASN